MRLGNSRARCNLHELPHPPRAGHGRIGTLVQLRTDRRRKRLVLLGYAIVGDDEWLALRRKESRGAPTGDGKSVDERGHFVPSITTPRRR